MRDSSLEALLLLASLFVVHAKLPKALTLLEGLRDLAPEDERVLRPLSHVLIEQKHYGRALDIIQELLSLPGEKMSAEDTACALRLKASALWNLDRREEARALLEQISAGPAGMKRQRKRDARI